MAFAMRSGLVALVAGVRTYLTVNGVDATVALGWKARARVGNQGPGGANRIVFTPSDDAGNGGRIVGTQQPGQRAVGGSGTPQTATGSVRALYDWQRVCVVSVWAIASAATGDEDARDAAQLEASESLVEWMMRAVQASGRANIQFGDVRWTIPDERSYGIEALVGLTFRHPIFDVPNEIVRPTPVITQDLEA